jgi:hypothetical protein
METSIDIENNIKNFLRIIERNVTSENRFKIANMISDNQLSLFTAPASTKTKYHGCFAGGLLVHSMAVYENMLRLVNVLTPEITLESVTIVSLFHDLGKAFTTSKQDYYIKNPDDWQVNKGTLFVINPEIHDGLTIAQRSIRILTKYDVALTDDEYQSILFHDGQYLDENKVVRFKESKLLLLLHCADFWTIQIEGK